MHVGEESHLDICFIFVLFGLLAIGIFVVAQVAAAQRRKTRGGRGLLRADSSSRLIAMAVSRLATPRSSGSTRGTAATPTTSVRDKSVPTNSAPSTTITRPAAARISKRTAFRASSSPRTCRSGRCGSGTRRFSTGLPGWSVCERSNWSRRSSTASFTSPRPIAAGPSTCCRKARWSSCWSRRGSRWSFSFARSWPAAAVCFSPPISTRPSQVIEGILSPAAGLAGARVTRT